jgi:hypothetical protein
MAAAHSRVAGIVPVHRATARTLGQVRATALELRRLKNVCAIRSV